jgi:gliding motility-associated-like protein
MSLKRISCITALILLFLLSHRVFAQDNNPFQQGTISITVDKGAVTAHKSIPTSEQRATVKSKPYASNQVLSTQAITINIQTISASCREVNGSINAVASGGTPPYKYKFDGDGPFDNGYYPRIEAGNHLVEVTDAIGNTGSVTAVVPNTNEPPVITVNSFSHPTSCDRADGSFVVSASGGQPPYEFTLDNVNFTTSGSFNNMPTGFYTVMVRDAKGCGNHAFVTLVGPAWCGIPFGLSFSSAFCGVEGKANITYYGNDGPYESSLNGAPYSTTLEYVNLSPGAYTLDLLSATGEKTKFMFHVVKACYPRTKIQVVDNTCNNADGRAILTTDNGSPPYRYSIDGINFQTSNEFSGLKPGRYNIGVIDNDGVIMRIVADVNGGCFGVTETHTNVVCSNHNGKIEITASGGKEPYTYSLNDGSFQSSNIFEGLEASNYHIIVQDADGKRKAISVEITDTPGFTHIMPKSPPACWGTTVKLTVLVGGGTPPIQYSINSIDYQNDPEFEIFTGQSYTVSAADANGCKVFVLYQPPLACFKVTVNIFNATCGSNNGRLQLNAADGVEPYEYSLDGTTFQASNIFSNLPAGTYEVTVRDADNIVRKMSAEIKSSCPELLLDIRNSICGGANGRIVAKGINGQLPYQYAINGSPYADQSTFENLTAGTYTLYLKDASGYIVQQQVSLSTTSNPQISVTASDAQCSTGGSISITASGSGPLLYSIDGVHFSSAAEFTELQPSDYRVYTMDNVGCKSSASAEIKLVDNLSFDIIDDLSVCESVPVLLSIKNGKSAYTYAWSSDDGSAVGSSPSVTVTPNQTTHYRLNVTEGHCSASRSVLVTVLPAPIANAGEDVTICSGQNAELKGSGGNTYTWIPATYLSNIATATPQVVKPEATQQYSLSVGDENGCKSIQADTVTVFVTPPAKLFPGNDTIIMKNTPFQLNATDINNSGFVSYIWTPAFGLSDATIANPVAILPSDATYTVTATTEAGCKSEGNITLKVYSGPDIYVPNAFTPNGDGLNDDFKIVAVGIKTFRSIAVFNRWGQQVYYSTDPSKGWNGFVGSKKADSGTYVWKAEGIDFNNKVIAKRGVVILIR